MTTKRSSIKHNVAKFIVVSAYEVEGRTEHNQTAYPSKEKGKINKGQGGLIFLIQNIEVIYIIEMKVHTILVRASA